MVFSKAKSSILLFSFLAVGCASEKQVQKALDQHPEYVFSVIEKNPERFMEIVQKASMRARVKSQEEEGKRERARLEEEMKNPLKFTWPADRATTGTKSAPIKIVEYSDFQCPFCGRGFMTVQALLKQYPGKIELMFKNLPLPMHPMAVPAAKRFEAIALQDPIKAYKFHDEVFQNQGKLGSEGEKFLDSVAKKVGANMAKMKKDMDGKAVDERINADTSEANGLGIQGTPGFLINGVALRGAMPIEKFKEIIDMKLKN